MSNIEWTDVTWNCLTGCTPVSHGCTNCYAAQMAATRLRDKPRYKGLAVLNSRGQGVFNGKVLMHEDKLLDPLRWRKPRMVFVNSMSDVFHEAVPFDFIDKMFAVMGLCPQHTFQILTKRPERMAAYLAHRAKSIEPLEAFARSLGRTFKFTGLDGGQHSLLPWPIPNIWIGTSCEDQATAEGRIPHLIKCPAVVRFLSCEPLLDEIDLSDWLALEIDRDGSWRRCTKFGAWPDLQWVITGGESGRSARPCTIGHIRSLVEQCAKADVACFVKQLGSRPVNREGVAHPIKDHHNIEEFPDDLKVRQYPEVAR